MTTDTIAGLRAARALIERGWTQYYHARNARGDGVPSAAKNAVAWCIEGSCFAVAPNAVRSRSLLDALLTESKAPSLPLWNDDRRRTKASVLRLFDRCIARLEAEKQP